MNIEHLREYIELSRQLNFTTASKRLHITQPALSNHVRTLEKETGTLLIERGSHHNARLTPAGQSFLEMANKIIALHDETVPALQNIQKNTEGKILIRSPRHEYSSPLLNYTYEFQNIHPHIDIVIQPWIETDGIEDVLSGAVECAYLGFCDYEDKAASKNYGVAFAPYSRAEILLWVDKEHPLAQKENLTIEDVNGFTLLIPSNKKHESWVLGIENIKRSFSLKCDVEEKYCDSLEDLVMNKTTSDDLLLCDASLLSFPPFQMRRGRTMKGFNPKVKLPVSLCYPTNNENPALQMFVNFLRNRFDKAAE